MTPEQAFSEYPNWRFDEFTRVGRYTSLAEGVARQAAIRVAQGDHVELLTVLQAISWLVWDVFELKLTTTSTASGYRTDQLNELVNGSPTSQHKEFKAGDLRVIWPAIPGRSMQQVKLDFLAIWQAVRESTIMEKIYQLRVYPDNHFAHVGAWTEQCNPARRHYAIIPIVGDPVMEYLGAPGGKK